MRSGGSLPLAGRKQRALLALLLLHANRVVTREAAVDALWQSPPKTADKIVRLYAARLQKLLGHDTLQARGSGYVLRAQAETIDAARFEELLERADSGRDAIALLRNALALWRGRALEDVVEDFARTESLRLEEARLTALERVLAAELEAGRASRVVGELEALVAAEPLRERPRELLMLALYRCGRQAEALTEYRRARDVLVEELGIEPSPALKRLQRAILRQDPSLDVIAANPPHLVAAATPFLGRETELERVVTLLRRADVRLLTLTGTGGIGKTRLAIEVAARVGDAFADGVHLVSLGSVADPALVLPTIAQTLGVLPLGGSVSAALRVHLRQRSLLLVLDSFEHVMPAAPELTDLLASAPGLKLLVTSTAVLHVYCEHEFVVPPLELPHPSNDHDRTALLGVPSVALFVHRAEAVNTEFTLDEASAPAVAEICRRLDGLPLAIELAGARTKLLPPHALLERLGHRLDLLGGGTRDGPARHQTLRATVDWSFGLLDEAEQQLFARLGVFAGGCTLEAAESVCGGDIVVLDTIASLVDKSLIRSSESRLSMLETLREYAVERLEASGEADELRCRHGTYFVALAERADPELRGAGQPQWYERLEADHDNFRAALAYMLGTGRTTRALRLAAALARFWQVRGYASEGRRWLLDALAREAGAASPWLRAKALHRAGVLCARSGRATEARPLLEESVELFRRIGDPKGLAGAVIILGWLASIEGAATQALALFERAADTYRRLDEQRGFAVALNDVGCARLLLGDAEGAARDCNEAASLSAEVGDRQSATYALQNAAYALLEVGREAEAVANITKSVELSRELGFKEGLAVALVAFSATAERRGDFERAGRLLAAADAFGESIGAVLDPCDRRVHDRVASSVSEELGDDVFAALWAEGRALDAEDALAEALEIPGSVG